METILFIGLGAVAGIFYAAWRLRAPQQSTLQAVRKVLPFGAGGPGPRQ